MNAQLPSRVEVYTSPPTGGRLDTTSIWVEASDFALDPKPASGKKLTPAAGPYLLLGFDTEFQTPNEPATRKDIAEGLAKFEVLSYQFHAKMSDGREWHGICCPGAGERMSLCAFIVFALGIGAREHGIREIPTTIYMTGHFTRADIPAFADFQDMTALFSCVRSTFISVDEHHKYVIPFPDEPINLRVYFRDTMLLAPATSKSLKALGELVGVPKLQLDPDMAVHRRMIRHMDEVRETNWGLFKQYALNDALICVRYIEQIINMYERVTGKKKVPLTLTSIGVDLLMKSWRETLDLKPVEILGKEEVTEKFYDKRLGYFRKKTEQPYLKEVDRHIAFVSETYHGGRNEQFWFGPGFEGDWSDWDLSSAYPTAMSLIGMPLWAETRFTTDFEEFGATTLGFAEVEFEFPPDTRYPTFPVRTSNGLVFPLSGTSNCSAPEIVVARNLGATLRIKYGVVVPTNPDIRIFGSFIKGCLEERKKAGSKTLTGLLWKEIGNSTYGKTAQGLMKKRVYDMRDRLTQPLPPSRITNPFFASYITSFVRGILGEIINSVGPGPCVYSCTTDGFLTNATADEVARAQQGELCQLFSRSRQDLTGDPRVLEVKHSIRQPLGWRTRGQATLIPGKPNPAAEDFNYVLAKGGIYLNDEIETVQERNDEIVRMFFERTPETVINIQTLTGVRDIVEHDADLVQKILTKRLSMEYDWKRRPLDLGWSERHEHVLFSTQPWQSVDQFVAIRNAWEDFTKGEPTCIQTIAAFNRFATYIDSHVGMPKELRKYLRKEKPDLYRLRALLCSAWKQAKAGLSCQEGGMSAAEFAETLCEFGIPCTKFDVENGKNRHFVPHSCPPTMLVRDKLNMLRLRFPNIQTAEFLHTDNSLEAISVRPTGVCPHVALAISQQRLFSKAA